VTLESDKATMECGAGGGVIKEVRIKIGDTVSQGSVIALLESERAAGAAAALAPAALPSVARAGTGQRARRRGRGARARHRRIQGCAGDRDSCATRRDRQAEDSLVTLNRTRRRWMSHRLCRATVSALEGQSWRSCIRRKCAVVARHRRGDAGWRGGGNCYEDDGSSAGPCGSKQWRTSQHAATDERGLRIAYAGPAVRRLARELRAISARSKAAATRAASSALMSRRSQERRRGGGRPRRQLSLVEEAQGWISLPWPKVDFAKFGPIDLQPLSRIKKISAAICIATG